MFEHKQLGYLDDTLELQSLFAFWCIDLDMQDSALSASKRIVDACKQLLPADAYRSARQSILVAQVGIYALARDAERILTQALNEYRDFRAQFKERHPNLRFVGDFESAEDDLLEGRAHLLLDSHTQQFRSVVSREHILLFFRLLDQSPA